MKKIIKNLSVAGFVAAVTVNSAFGQTNGVVTVDEQGVGTFVSGGVTTSLFSTTATDLNSGITSLVYVLPFVAQAGDVVLTDSTGLATDVYRFDGSNKLFVFSDVSIADPSDSLADVGLPGTYLSSVVFFPEVGPEAGPNGYFGYNPGGPNIPGINAFGATFNFISDAAPIPEPGSLALLASGLGIFGFRFWRRR